MTAVYCGNGVVTALCSGHGVMTAVYSGHGVVISDLPVPCGCHSRLCPSGVQLHAQVQSQVGTTVTLWNGHMMP